MTDDCVLAYTGGGANQLLIAIGIGLAIAGAAVLLWRREATRGRRTGTLAVLALLAAGAVTAALLTNPVAAFADDSDCVSASPSATESSESPTASTEPSDSAEPTDSPSPSETPTTTEPSETPTTPACVADDTGLDRVEVAFYDSKVKLFSGDVVGLLGAAGATYSYSVASTTTGEGTWRAPDPATGQSTQIDGLQESFTEEPTSGTYGSYAVDGNTVTFGDPSWSFPAESWWDLVSEKQEDYQADYPGISFSYSSESMEITWTLVITVVDSCGVEHERSLTQTEEGGAAAGGGGSDTRLKQDIDYLFTTDGGLRIYSFRYLADPSQQWVGVMAQDLLVSHPEALSIGDDGYFRVNYLALGLRMLTMEQYLQGVPVER